MQSRGTDHPPENPTWHLTAVRGRRRSGLTRSVRSGRPSSTSTGRPRPTRAAGGSSTRALMDS